MTLRPRSSSSCRESLRSTSKPVSYVNINTNSNDENEKLMKRKPKKRQSAEPSKSYLQAQELISKQQVLKTDSDSSSSKTETSHGEQEPVNENENSTNTDKKSSNNTTPKGSFVTTHHGLPNKPKTHLEI